MQASYTRSVLLFLVFVLGCERFEEWPLETTEEGRLVVEAILTNESRVQEIKLSQSYADLQEPVPVVDDARVYVEANQVIYEFLQDTILAGVYRSEIPFRVFDNLIYNLHIEWQGENYTAKSELSNVAPMPDIYFEEDSMEMLFFAPFYQIYNSSQQSMYEMDVDWTHLSNEELTEAKLFFYTFSSIDISSGVPPPSELVKFPRGSFIIAKKFGLNDDFADFLRSSLIETQWKGSVFYSTSENIPTNLSNGALGFFSTCAVLIDTLIAK